VTFIDKLTGAHTTFPAFSPSQQPYSGTVRELFGLRANGAKVPFSFQKGLVFPRGAGVTVTGPVQNTLTFKPSTGPQAVAFIDPLPPYSTTFQGGPLSIALNDYTNLMLGDQVFPSFGKTSGLSGAVIPVKGIKSNGSFVPYNFQENVVLPPSAEVLITGPVRDKITFKTSGGPDAIAYEDVSYSHDGSGEPIPSERNAAMFTSDNIKVESGEYPEVNLVGSVLDVVLKNNTENPGVLGVVNYVYGIRPNGYRVKYKVKTNVLFPPNITVTVKGPDNDVMTLKGSDGQETEAKKDVE